MTVMVYGITIFCAAFLFHIFIWRIRIPKRQTRALLQLFSVSFIAGFIVLIAARQHLTSVEYLHIVLLFFSLTFAYIAAYTGIEADSPTLVIIMNIANAGTKGASKEDISLIMTDDLLIMPRVDDLADAKMVYLSENRYKITLRGALFVRIFIFYRELLKVNKGG